MAQPQRLPFVPQNQVSRRVVLAAAQLQRQSPPSKELFKLLHFWDTSQAELQPVAISHRTAAATAATTMDYPPDEAAPWAAGRPTHNNNQHNNGAVPSGCVLCHDISQANFLEPYQGGTRRAAVHRPPTAATTTTRSSCPVPEPAVTARRAGSQRRATPRP